MIPNKRLKIVANENFNLKKKLRGLLQIMSGQNFTQSAYISGRMFEFAEYLIRSVPKNSTICQSCQLTQAI